MYFVKLGRDLLHDPRSDDTHLVSIEMGQELNTCGYCTFKIAPTHPLRGKLRERDSGNPVEVYDNDTLLFSGFVWELGQKFDLMGEVSCKGELAYLGDTTVRPYSTGAGAAPLQAPSTVDGYFRWLIDQHNAHTDASKHFEVGINQGARLDPNNHILRASNQIPRTADELQEKLLDSPGGYVFTRHERGIRYIDYLSECADVNAQVIDFGVNLLDYLRTDSAAKLYTAVRPQGSEIDDAEGQGTGEYLTIEALPDGVYAKDGDYRKVGDTVYNVDAAQRYGLIELAWSNRDITIAENLLDAGVIALKEFVEPKTTIEIKALDMALIDPSAKPLRTGQLVRVRSRPHHFDSYMLVSKIEPVLDRPDQTLYTLGTTFDSLTGETNRTIRKLNASIIGAYDAMAPIDQAAKDATQQAATAQDVANESNVNSASAISRADSATATASSAIDAAQRAEALSTEAKSTSDAANVTASNANDAATEAKSTATQANVTADSKRRVFYSQPVPPYDNGDLWSQGTAGDMLICSTHKTDGMSFLASDWGKASKYTDDTKAIEAEGLAAEAAKTATDFIDFGADGLIVGDMTDGALSGNVRIASDGIELRDGSSVLARLKAGILELAANSANAIIKLCGGKGTIAYYAATNQLAIMSPGSIAMTACQTLPDGTVQPYEAGIACNRYGVVARGAVEVLGTMSINGQGVSDYVVAQGTSGIWRWRKWASGDAECQMRTVQTFATTTPWGSLYYDVSNSGGWAFPFAFNGTPNVSVDMLNGAVFPFVNDDATASNACTFWAVSAGPYNSLNVTIEVKAEGRWKP